MKFCVSLFGSASCFAWFWERLLGQTSTCKILLIIAPGTFRKFLFQITYISLFYNISYKAHTDRTRFGNATRILNFQCRLALIFFHFSQTLGNVLAI